MTKRAFVEEEGTRSKSNGAILRHVVLQTLSAIKENDEAGLNQLDLLVAQIKSQAYPPASLAVLLDCLASDVSALDVSPAQPLVTAILNVSLVENGLSSPDFITSYSTFLTLLVSSSPKWWDEVVSKILNEFALRNNLDDHHLILRKLIHLVPTASNALPKLIRKNYPHIRSSTEDICNYAQNILKITEYLPEIQFDVWKMIVSTVVSLDVELQNSVDEVDDEDLDEALDQTDEEEEEEEEEDEEEDDDDDDDDEHDDDDDEDEDDDDDDEADISNDPLSPEKLDETYLKALQTTKQLSHKLDTIVSTLLHYLDSQFKEVDDYTISLFMTLTKVFTTHILPTYGTRLSQYLIFYCAQSHAELNDAFIVLLFETIFAATSNHHIQFANASVSESGYKSVPINVRIKSAQYIATYVARAKTLTTSQIGHVVKLITEWCTMYIKSVERENSIDDKPKSADPSLPVRHPLLYALTQALMYIFCFRHSQMHTADGWVCDLDKFFTKLMNSRFDIFRWTDETVVLIFARVAQQEGLCYAWSAVEVLRRERASGGIVYDPQGQEQEQVQGQEQEQGQGQGQGQKGNYKKGNVQIRTEGTLRATQELLDLESWFPFDPVLLKKTRQIIVDRYVEWEESESE
ncbi:rDNA-binding RNA polymerase I transcriptional factor [Martiniozyma asiatica (nom. inval.)]|nr:rDNA-binding RNA polymerase I transcriptional factor [Martiniozyma asiatica]